MLIFISILLCFFPVVLIFYPLIKDEKNKNIQNSNNFNFQQKWDSLLEGLQNAELEFSIGTIDEEDYKWLQKTYTKEILALIKEFNISVSEEKELMQKIDEEINKIKKNL